MVRPGQTFAVERYTIRYDGVETRRDPNMREAIARLTVLQGGRQVARLAPAKRVYTTHRNQPTSEVSIWVRLREDVYTVLASVNATTHEAHLKAFVDPFTVWIWLGCIVLIFGTAIAIWPEVSLGLVRGGAGDPGGGAANGGGGGGGGGGGAGREAEGVAGVPAVARAGRAAVLVALAALGLGAVLFARPARAQGHTSGAPPPVAGDAEQMGPDERRLFSRMLCMCGDCQRLPLETCTCDFAATRRAQMRAQMREGMSADEIVRRYVARFGAAALAVPPDVGHNRLVYALPIAVVLAGGALAVRLVRRWPRARAWSPRARRTRATRATRSRPSTTRGSGPGAAGSMTELSRAGGHRGAGTATAVVAGVVAVGGVVTWLRFGMPAVVLWVAFGVLAGAILLFWESARAVLTPARAGRRGGGRGDGDRARRSRGQEAGGAARAEGHRVRALDPADLGRGLRGAARAGTGPTRGRRWRRSIARSRRTCRGPRG